MQIIELFLTDLCKKLMCWRSCHKQ